jgi:ribosomal protein S18 acetylase RimI-like enzyme
MTAGCKIRPFEPDDLPRLHEIREAAYKPVFASFRAIVGETIAPAAFAGAEKEQADYLDKICDERSSHDVYVVEHGSQIAGFLSVTLNPESRVGEIDLNAVHPDFQGQGIGTLMYEFALERMREAGMTVATVGTGGDPSHAPARRAYERTGFGRGIASIYLYRRL